MRHPRYFSADPYCAACDRMPLRVGLDNTPKLRDLRELRVRREAPDNLPNMRWRDPACDWPVWVQVSDDWGGRRGNVRAAVPEEGEEAAAVVGVPVREDDAVDELDGRLEGLDVADDRARIGASVEECVVGRGAFGFGLLLVCPFSVPLARRSG